MLFLLVVVFFVLIAIGIYYDVKEGCVKEGRRDRLLDDVSPSRKDKGD